MSDRPPAGTTGARGPRALPTYFLAGAFLAVAFFAFTRRFQAWRRFMMRRTCLLFDLAIGPP